MLFHIGNGAQLFIITSSRGKVFKAKSFFISSCPVVIHGQKTCDNLLKSQIIFMFSVLKEEIIRLFFCLFSGLLSFGAGFADRPPAQHSYVSGKPVITVFSFLTEYPVQTGKHFSPWRAAVSLSFVSMAASAKKGPLTS